MILMKEWLDDKTAFALDSQLTKNYHSNREDPFIQMVKPSTQSTLAHWTFRHFWDALDLNFSA